MCTDAWSGIDVGATALAVAIEDAEGHVQEFTVANDAAGHRTLRRRLTKAGHAVRVCLEATGIYHLEVALVLHATPGVTVMVANPRATKDFARAGMQRAKTDRVDARRLVEFGKRMPFRPWTPPPAAVRNLQALARRIAVLTRTRVQERNRLHAGRHRHDLGAALAAASQAHLAFLDASIRTLMAEATRVLETDPGLARRCAQLVSIPGVGERSAVRLLGELAGLPADMTVRQWVAHAGLDPRPFTSGTSVHRAPRISRTGNAHLRAALYMPALVAVRCDPHARRFYETLRGRQKKPKQALVAVMRKLLHAIYGMFLHDETYAPTKCYRAVA